eukprot:TRINITY_DN2381_c0_g10_i1.p1 TRINITY_DN2381_c0_g10~~TRINITY_DN2381_c0_g10_i1.p1  ORF type:complete len:366 (-),score=109.85 TRINITY_DN2381_c0_g10_i1:7-1104(-)
MGELQRSMKKRNKALQKVMEEKLQKEEREKRLSEIEEQKINEAKKKETALKKQEDFLAKREERNKLLEYARNSPSHKLYLYKKMAEQYLTEVEVAEQQKQQLIVNRHQAFKSIRLKDLKSLNKSLDDSLQRHKQEHSQLLSQNRRNEQMYMKLVKSNYKTLVMEQIIREEQSEKEQQGTDLLRQKEAYTKRLEYARTVRKSHPPRERELKSPLKEEKGFLKKRSSLKRVSYSYKLKLKKPKSGTGETVETNQVRQKARSSLQSITKNAKIFSEKGKTIDYLKEMRSHRTSRKHHSFLQDKSLSKQEKYILLKSRMEVIQESIDLKEKLLNVNKEAINLDVEQEVADMYVEAIKAKLHILELADDN